MCTSSSEVPCSKRMAATNTSPTFGADAGSGLGVRLADHHTPQGLNAFGQLAFGLTQLAHQDKPQVLQWLACAGAAHRGGVGGMRSKDDYCDGERDFVYVCLKELAFSVPVKKILLFQSL